MDNNRIYEATRSCPGNALRTINAGKLKGKSDINPMWRIKQLTELFGPCGQGWKTQNEEFWSTPAANGEVVAWCRLELLWRENGGDWSEPVLGIGGSMLVDTQKGKLASNDEAYKMAHTDAISVACKQLGFAADVYWGADSTKYTRNEQAAAANAQATPPPAPICAVCNAPIKGMTKDGKLVWSVQDIVTNSNRAYGKTMCWDCMMKAKHEKPNNQ